MKKTEEFFKTTNDLNEYREFEIYRGKNNFYDIIEIQDNSLLASLLPFIWFYHHRLYSPLFLMVATFLLLGSIAWWLFLAAWVILTIYMSRGAMSLLRGYCLFQEMRPYMKVYAFSIKQAQEVVRSLDKKSNYRFPFIAPPEVIENTEKNEDSNDKDMKVSQAT